ncbi:unnamed protein product [Didymodactylos carnosus]|uniref:Ionotropic glutamate receptor C-terminal domain-containing protein n=1 Tax=Didymodactylos carnosus TaxID=1234261 RepID=A0A814YH68_9BILA|nr:unnamed protein product [Didymodactylos carnosus]CAF1229476.1 unnamed protein product [Didymodactylos carnosus]CAF3992187.1 unnamed protein product [Didymodactylos carnosus]CAF4036255.1 unnamed protein product [Didymodactylos carnosus]
MTKMPLWDLRWSFLLFIFGQLDVHYVRATWPSPNSSGVIQLLGLFPDKENASKPTDLSVQSRAMFKAAVLLSQQYNITIEGQFIEWQVIQTGGTAINAISSTCQAISASNIVGIVGPGLSRETLIIADFAEKVGIPVVSYSATDPDLSDRNAYPAFYRTVPSDNAAASAIVQLFIQFNWTSCVIIYQNDAFGYDGARVISEAFINKGFKVADTVAFDIATHNYQDDLARSLTTSATRIVLLWAEPTYTSLILQDALDANVLGPSFTWILSSSVSLDSFNQTFYSNLTGMLTIEPTTATTVGASSNTTLLNATYAIWQQYENETFPWSTMVNPYALFAFDATWLLIQSLQQLCSTTTNSSSSCISFDGSSFCFDRRFLNSNSFFDTVTNMTFLGVSGPIEFDVNVTDRINGSYYYAQNSQQPSSNKISFVPVLAYSDQNNWQQYAGENSIIWPGSSSQPPTGIPKLDGVTLRIGVIESDPFTIITIVEGKTQVTGYIKDLIDELQSITNFIPDIRVAPSNETYDALVQAVADGVYDIVVGDVTLTANRRKIVGFSRSIFDNSLRLLMRKTPDASVDLLAFLKPFSRNLWLLILAAVVYAGILISLLEREENEALQNRSIISLCAMSMWYSFGQLVGYGADFDANTAAGRLLTIGLYIVSIVLVASYTANLASDLTISKSQSVISGIGDIKAGKIPSNRIGIRVGTASQDFYLAEISNNNPNYFPIIGANTRQQSYDDLLAGIIDVTFLDTGVAEYITNNIYCNLTLVGDGFDEGEFGIVTPIGWLYGNDLDVSILALRQNGTLDDLKAKWFESQTCPDATTTSTALGIEAMSGLFLVFAVVSGLSLLLFVWKKRYIIINFLFKLAGRKTSFGKKKGSARRRSRKTSKDSQNSQLPPSDFFHF